MFFDANTLKLSGNVVKISKLYMTNHSHKYFAYLTLAMHEANHTTFAECVAWSKMAEKVASLKNAKKVYVKARLTDGNDNSKHGDKFQTLVPNIKAVKVLSKKSNHKSANQDSQNTKHAKASEKKVASK